MANAPDNFFTLDVEALNKLIEEHPPEKSFVTKDVSRSFVSDEFTLPTHTTIGFEVNANENQILRFNGDKAEWVDSPNADADLEKLHQLQERVKQLEELTNIQCDKGTWDYDPYMHGMANGMILALAMMEDVEPEFLSAPKKWGYTKMPNKIECMEQDFSESGKTKSDKIKYDRAMQSLGL